MPSIVAMPKIEMKPLSRINIATESVKFCDSPNTMVARPEDRNACEHGATGVPPELRLAEPDYDFCFWGRTVVSMAWRARAAAFASRVFGLLRSRSLSGWVRANSARLPSH